MGKVQKKAVIERKLSWGMLEARGQEHKEGQRKGRFLPDPCFQGSEVGLEHWQYQGEER